MPRVGIVPSITMRAHDSRHGAERDTAAARIAV